MIPAVVRCCPKGTYCGHHSLNPCFHQGTLVAERILSATLGEPAERYMAEESEE